MTRLLSAGLIGPLTAGWLAACAVQPEPLVTTPRTYQGAGAGAAVGAGVGALIDKDNRWHGAALGAALGAVLGGTLTEFSSRAAHEAAAQNGPVMYQTTDGWQRVEARPTGGRPPAAGRCRSACTRTGGSSTSVSARCAEELAHDRDGARPDSTPGVARRSATAKPGVSLPETFQGSGRPKRGDRHSLQLWTKGGQEPPNDREA